MKSLLRLSRMAMFSLLLHGLAEAQGQPEIVEIEVEGNLRRVAESLILSTIGLSPGVELSMENVQIAVHDLWNLNVFEDIQVYREYVEGGVKLIIEVEEAPTLEGIRFKGQKQLKEKEMEEALGLIEGQVITATSVARGRQKVLDLYKDKGYLRAEVSGKRFAAEEEGKVFLQYDIKEREKVKIKRINILNSYALEGRKWWWPISRPSGWITSSEDQIKKQMETKEKKWWRKGEFKAETYREDKEKILALYKSQGFQQAFIVRDSVYYDESQNKLFIDIEMDEGDKYYMGKVTWDGNALFANADLADKLGLEEGDVYKFSGPELAWLVQSAYYEKGYLNTDVRPQEVFRGEFVDVHFQIFEGQPFKIRRIDIAGNTRTREKVIRRELELRPGDIYQQSLAQESQRRLHMLNFFKDVQIQPEFSPDPEKRFVDLNFKVEERRTGQAMMGAGYSDRDKLLGQIGLQIPNLRGTGQNLDFRWEFGTRREQFLIGFTEPWLFNTPTSLSARLSMLSLEYFNYYDSKRNSASVRIGRRLKKPSNTTLSAGYQLQEVKYTNVDTTYDRSYLRPVTTSSFNLFYQRDTRDLPQFSTKGTLFTYRPELATALAFGNVDFHRHEVTFNYYRPSWWKFVISAESKVAFIDGFTAEDDLNISTWDRFSPGGVDWWDGQVRGYPDRSLGPRPGGLPIGGTSMMVLNIEYRFPVVEQQIYGLLFADAGNAWAKIDALNPLHPERSIGDLRRSVGFGFRVMAPMLGMIGFDFGYGFDREKVDGQQAGWSTHFQFGPQIY
ncbi:MAG: outer membrane protein assembly factor BamA [Gemmatimonadetes bacterium]|nr:outer membrane protein assembly factor BamA [Gemmatimonadota bacterium]